MTSFTISIKYIQPPQLFLHGCGFPNSDICITIPSGKIGRLETESGPEWVVYDPVASIISKQNGQITVDGLGKINASKPLRRGELEYFDPRFAAEYLTMPRRISNIEKLLEDLVKKEKAKENHESETISSSSNIANEYDSQ